MCCCNQSLKRPAAHIFFTFKSGPDCREHAHTGSLDYTLFPQVFWDYLALERTVRGLCGCAGADRKAEPNSSNHVSNSPREHLLAQSLYPDVCDPRGLHPDEPGYQVGLLLLLHMHRLDTGGGGDEPTATLLSHLTQFPTISHNFPQVKVRCELVGHCMCRRALIGTHPMQEAMKQLCCPRCPKLP
jgi:hypothetical protein